MNTITILSLFWSGAAVTLLGVLAGGMFVFRTRRDSHEVFMPHKAVDDHEGPINIDEVAVTGPRDSMEEDVLPDIMALNSLKFLSQVAREKENGNAEAQAG